MRKMGDGDGERIGDVDRARGRIEPELRCDQTRDRDLVRPTIAGHCLLDLVRTVGGHRQAVAGCRNEQ
jgi:hypothetical protein